MDVKYTHPKRGTWSNFNTIGFCDFIMSADSAESRITWLARFAIDVFSSCVAHARKSPRTRFPPFFFFFKSPNGGGWVGVGANCFLLCGLVIYALRKSHFPLKEGTPASTQR